MYEQAKQEAMLLLQERAKLKDIMTYSELAAKISSVSFEAHDPRLFRLLEEISRDEDALGHGMLSVIVVHKHGDKQPGQGFFELAKELDRDTANKKNCWISELNKVYTYWSINKPLSDVPHE